MMSDYLWGYYLAALVLLGMGSYCVAWKQYGIATFHLGVFLMILAQSLRG